MKPSDNKVENLKNTVEILEINNTESFHVKLLYILH